jgi:VanZ family protein
VKVLIERFRPVARIVTIIYWLTIFTLTHLPPTRVPDVHVSDKILHFAVYALLGVLFCACFPPRRWMILIFIAVLMAYGAIDELTQPYFRRTCDIHDWYADTAGAITAVLICALISRQSRSNPV